VAADRLGIAGVPDVNADDPRVAEFSEATDRIWAAIEAEISDPIERVAHIARTFGKHGMMSYRSYCRHHDGNPT
jgi:hypothetical protein